MRILAGKVTNQHELPRLGKVLSVKPVEGFERFYIKITCEHGSRLARSSDYVEVLSASR